MPLLIICFQIIVFAKLLSHLLINVLVTFPSNVSTIFRSICIVIIVLCSCLHIVIFVAMHWLGRVYTYGYVIGSIFVDYLIPSTVCLPWISTRALRPKHPDSGRYLLLRLTLCSPHRPHMWPISSPYVAHTVAIRAGPDGSHTDPTQNPTNTPHWSHVGPTWDPSWSHLGCPTWVPDGATRQNPCGPHGTHLGPTWACWLGWGHPRSPTVFLQITWDWEELETWKWSQCVFLVNTLRLICNLGHAVTLTWGQILTLTFQGHTIHFSMRLDEANTMVSKSLLYHFKHRSCHRKTVSLKNAVFDLSWPLTLKRLILGEIWRHLRKRAFQESVSRAFLLLF